MHSPVPRAKARHFYFFSGISLFFIFLKSTRQCLRDLNFAVTSYFRLYVHLSNNLFVVMLGMYVSVPRPAVSGVSMY